MTDINEYITAREYSNESGVSVPTLIKWSKEAIGTDYDLGEPDRKVSNSKLYHRDKFRRLRIGRLMDAVNEAIELGVVVKREGMDDALKLSYQNGYNLGFEAGVDSVTSELPIDPDSEDAEVQNFTGLTYGGFKPVV